MKLEDEQPPEHKPGDRIVPELLKLDREQRKEADRRLFRAMVDAGMAARWPINLTDKDRRYLKNLLISPE